MRLRAGPECPLDQQRILRLRARLPTQLRAFFALCENAADGPRTFPFQGAGEPRAFGDVAGFLAVRFFEHDRRIGFGAPRRVRSPTAAVRC